ncbi:MAG TPA: DUF4431 domain-containing protein [Acidobacteriaceae bacterium]
MLLFRVAGVLILLSAASAVGQTGRIGSCLSYEPAVVRLGGILKHETVPGPPNYEDVRKGDRPETYWFVELSRPICVGEDKAEPDVNPAKNKITRVQLVLDPEAYTAYAGLMGRRVMATGTLFAAITGHHHTPV